MFVYEKKLQYPVNIKTTNPKLAKIIITQYGGPDGELGASLRYLSQRFTMPMPELKGTLTDIGTEELNHLEMIGAIVYQLTKNLTEAQIKAAGFEDYFVDHTTGIYPQSAGGTPFTAAAMQSKGDPITDLHDLSPVRGRYAVYGSRDAEQGRSDHRPARKHGGRGKRGESATYASSAYIFQKEIVFYTVHVLY